MKPMNTDVVLQFFQQGFRAALGATTSAVEAVQDPQKINQTINKLTTNPTQLAQEWIEKGAVTEQEARQVVDRFWQQRQNPSASGVTVTTTAVPVAPDVQAELQELTAQLSAIRAELSKLREQRSGA